MNVAFKYLSSFEEDNIQVLGPKSQLLYLLNKRGINIPETIIAYNSKEICIEGEDLSRLIAVIENDAAKFTGCPKQQMTFSYVVDCNKNFNIPRYFCIDSNTSVPLKGNHESTTAITIEKLLEEIQTLILSGKSVVAIQLVRPLSSASKIGCFINLPFSSTPISYCSSASSHLVYKEIQDLTKKEVETGNAYCKVINEMIGSNFIIFLGFEANRAYILSIENHNFELHGRYEKLVEDFHCGTRTKSEVVIMINPNDLQILKSPSILNKDSLHPLAKGVSAGNRIISGRLAVDESSITKILAEGDSVILISEELLPEEVVLFEKLEGVISIKGGVSSHLAIVAKGMNKACIAGVNTSKTFDGNSNPEMLNGMIGEWVTIHEPDGIVYKGKGEYSRYANSSSIKELIKLCKEIKETNILVNADYPNEVTVALEAGAEGVGLCRSENHILSSNTLPIFWGILGIRDDFKRLLLIRQFKANLQEKLESLLIVLNGKPLHYRLLDVPLNEFLPKTVESLEGFIEFEGEDLHCLFKNLSDYREENTLMGMRGCRIGIVHPEIYEAQIEAIVGAVNNIKSNSSIDLTLILPVISFKEELVYWKNKIQKEINNLSPDVIITPIKIGVMIETPRAAIISDQLASEISLISFGSNDLTQSTLTISRDDFYRFSDNYHQAQLLVENPFTVLDKDGVGFLIAHCIDNSRKYNSQIKTQICGVHASNIENFNWLYDAGIDTLSVNVDSLEQIIVKAAQRKICSTSASENVIMARAIARQQNVIMHSSLALQQITDCLRRSDQAGGRSVAYSWAYDISKLYNFSYSNNWKFFKRDLVTHWFGKREFKRFYTQWSSIEVFDYAIDLREKFETKIRYSLFPQDIACQSKTDVFPVDTGNDYWMELIDMLDHNAAIEIFPQQHEDQFCFRLIQRELSYIIEAGIGAAVNIFWKEAGQHLLIKGEYNLVKDSLFTTDPLTMEEANLATLTKEFHNKWGLKLLFKCFDLKHSLGVNWISIEGYFDFKRNGTLFIADIDIPMDVAFYGK